MFKTCIMILCASLSAAWVDPLHDKVNEGNKAYRDKKYPEAVQKYSEAEQYAGGESAGKLSFNKGAAEYMAGNYDKAAMLFGEAVLSDDMDVQKKSFFNMGNAYLKMNKKKEAFESYKNALKIDPSYMNAKKNIEYLLKKQDDENKQNKNNEPDKQEQNNNGQNDESNNDDRQKQTREQDQEQMNVEQLKNLLESMKNKPARRSKGNSGRYVEKDW
ncbi:MAG: tetratricopeptide repeat protein [Leptospirales bacterium]|nr:tetratricopeptide repeat protein [Leptospirales bacterium]